MDKTRWGFGVTNPTTGERAYIGPFSTKARARIEMNKRVGKNKRLINLDTSIWKRANKMIR